MKQNGACLRKSSRTKTLPWDERLILALGKYAKAESLQAVYTMRTFTLHLPLGFQWFQGDTVKIMVFVSFLFAGISS